MFSLLAATEQTTTWPEAFMMILVVILLVFIAMILAAIADHLGVPLPWERKHD